MSNYNNKNPVWGSKPGINQSGSISGSMQPQLGALGNMNHSGMVPFQQQQVFQNIGLNQQNLGLGLQQMTANQLNASLASNPIFQQQISAVSYPNPRGLNPTAFQNVSNNSGPGSKQRVFTGSITQVHDKFGFIDDEVFFPRNACVKGSNPVTGDRVLVEANYNPSMPFKWNATRVQVLSGAQQSRDPRAARDNQSSYNAVPPLSDSSNGFGRRDSGKDRPKSLAGERRNRSRDRDDSEIERKRRREERLREREKDDKDRKSPTRRRSRSPKARRRSRIVPRYTVQIPNISLDLKQADVLEVKRRYSNLYIPSDFFNTYIRWVDAFPPDKPYTINKPCSFHIMYKELDNIFENDVVLEPPDANYTFSAKVMLMSVPGLEEIYQKCCGMAEDREKKDRDSEEGDFVHPTRLINFLVGVRGKNETMAIGGPWSPSLDGGNPESDPSVLIKTAIRTCKALTGIDLSQCTQWYRFMELYYRRGETTHKGKVIPARVETVVFFLPDVWSCLPTRLEWEDLRRSYRNHLDEILKSHGGTEECDENGANDEKDEDEKLEPTHYSKLEPKSMQVAELRNELKARRLSCKGLKSQLAARLTKTLKLEAAAAGEVSKDSEPMEVVDAEEGVEEKEKKSESEERKIDEQQRRRLEKQYTLPDHPHLIIHPSKTAKSGKFDCTTMSLSILLDYRPEDTKEHSFEVSLFVELFNEMLMRDFGFNIFKAIYELPEKSKEKEEDKKKKEEKKDDKKGDDKKKDKKEDEKTDLDKKSIESEPKKSKEDSEKKKEKDYKKDDRSDTDDEDEDDVDDRKDKKDKEKKKKDRVKLYTKNKHLLLSFVYFDQTHCGYIFDKDVEELLYVLGLNLSRSQVKKIVSKVITRDSLHYRKLTDKPKDEEGEKPADSVKPCEINWHDLSQGNKKLLPIFKNGETLLNKAKSDDSCGSNFDNTGLIVYQGAVVDIGKLLNQLDRSEKARIETEQLIQDLKNEHHKLSDKYTKSVSSIKHLNSEVKEYKEKLRYTEDALGRSNAHAKLFQTTLIDIREKIDPVLKTASHKEKEDRKDRDRDIEKKKEKEDGKSRWEREKERETSRREGEKDTNKKENDVKKEVKDKEVIEVVKKEETLMEIGLVKKEDSCSGVTEEKADKNATPENTGKLQIKIEKES